MKKNKLQIKNLGDGEIEILIYDEIGIFAIQAKDIIEQIRQAGEIKTIKLRINSPGGDVFEGFALYSFLRDHSAEIKVQIDGVAASIASIVAMAGDEIIMSEPAMMMIHNPWAFTGGDASELRELADLLDKIKESLITVYEKRTSKTRDEIETLLNETTWFTAEEALEAGLIDSIAEHMQVAAKFTDRLACFPNCPDTLQAAASAPATFIGVDLGTDEISAYFQSDEGIAPPGTPIEELRENPKFKLIKIEPVNKQCTCSNAPANQPAPTPAPETLPQDHLNRKREIELLEIELDQPIQ